MLSSRSLTLCALLLGALIASNAAGSKSGAACSPLRGTTGLRPTQTVLRGRIDADLHTDRVFIAIRPDSSISCRYAIVADLGRRIVTTPIIQRGIGDAPTQQRWATGTPTLKALALIDDRAGAEIVVTQWAGASTYFVAVYSVRRGKLMRYRLGPDFQFPAPSTNLAPYGGSLGEVDAINCAAGRSGGLVVASTATPHGNGFSIVRRYYRVDGLRLRKLRTARVSASDLTAEYGGPFSRCSVATARR